MDNEKDRGKEINEMPSCCCGPSKRKPEDKDDRQDSASCCGSGASGEGCSAVSVFKAIIFFIVVFAAIVMAGRSMLTKNKAVESADDVTQQGITEEKMMGGSASKSKASFHVPGGKCCSK